VWKRSNVLLIGNPSYDEIWFNNRVEHSIGGGIYYSLKLLSKIPLTSIYMVTSSDPYTLIKIIGSSIHSIREEIILYSKTPFHYKLVYTGKDRELYLLSKSNTLTSNMIPSTTYDLAIVSPIYNEVDLVLLKRISSQSTIVALDIQGFIRCVDKNGKIHHTCTNLCTEIINYADIIHMNMSEALHYIKCLGLRKPEDLLMFTDKIFIITNSWKPLYILSDKDILEIKPYRVYGDETGAGDIYLAAFSIHYQQNMDLLSAALFASETTIQKIIYGEIIDIHDLGRYRPREIRFVNKISL